MLEFLCAALGGGGWAEEAGLRRHGIGGVEVFELLVPGAAPLRVRLDRLEGRGMNRDDATARIESQVTDDERRAVAQFVVGNGGDLAALEGVVDELWSQLVALNAERG